VDATLDHQPPALPFDCVDFDVKLSDKPRKFYRVRPP
jgi:hypothetical protein